MPAQPHRTVCQLCGRSQSAPVTVVLDHAATRLIRQLGPRDPIAEKSRQAHHIHGIERGAQQCIPEQRVAGLRPKSACRQEAAAAHGKCVADVVGRQQCVGRPARAVPPSSPRAEQRIVPVHEVENRVAVRLASHAKQTAARQLVAGAEEQHEVGLTVSDRAVGCRHGVRGFRRAHPVVLRQPSLSAAGIPDHHRVPAHPLLTHETVDGSGG